MPRVSHRAAISFGLVHIPVSLYTATQDNDIRFNQLCKEDGSRIKYKKVCASCGKEVGPEDIIKGFAYADGKYVTVSDEEFEKIKTEKDRAIQILHFTDLDSIRPSYYEKTYHAVPDAGGDKAFALLRQAMLDERKVAIGKAVLGQKETMLCLIPTSEGMLMETLYYRDEIKEIPKEYARPEVSGQELEMAKTLIESMDKPFQPELYHDEYQQKIRQLIEDKIAGKEIIEAKPEQQGNIIDLMAALQASVEQAKQQNKPKRKKASNA